MTETTIPSELLGAIVAPAGGQIVVIVGAGCSSEPPTSVPMSPELSELAHERLMANGDLSDGECAAPKDLSALAQAVARRHGGQAKLIGCLPVDLMRTATPNSGYLIAAALLIEQAVACVLTLNFDLAMTTALATLGSRDAVVVVNGPEGLGRLGIINVIYLHRNVDAEPDDWILTGEALESGWQGQWREVIVVRVLTAPVTIFAGLGTPIAVLTEMAKRVRDAIGDRLAYLVDPEPPDKSAFRAALEVPDEAYIRMGWSAFMGRLGARLVTEQLMLFKSCCETCASGRGWPAEDIVSLNDSLAGMGLVKFGFIRGNWFLDDRPYVPARGLQPEWIAELLLTIAWIARMTAADAILNEDGTVEFRSGMVVRSVVALIHGRGSVARVSADRGLERYEVRFARGNVGRKVAVVTGMTGDAAADAVPTSIVAKEDPTGLIGGPSVPQIWSVDELRLSPDLLNDLVP